MSQIFVKLHKIAKIMFLFRRGSYETKHDCLWNDAIQLQRHPYHKETKCVESAPFIDYNLDHQVLACNLFAHAVTLKTFRLKEILLEIIQIHIQRL